MTKRNDFYMEIEASSYINKRVTIKVTITNGSPHDYTINRSAIWDGNFYGELPFMISGPSYISCYGAPTFHFGLQKGIEIKSTQSVSHTLELSNYCNFNGAIPGIYTIKGWANTFLYTSIEDIQSIVEAKKFPDESINLSANTTFILRENDAEYKYSQDATGANSVTTNGNDF